MPKSGRKNSSGTNLWDFLIASINKGQLLIALTGIIFLTIVLKLPPEDASRLLFHIVGLLERGSIVGYALLGPALVGWFLHAKWQRRQFAIENERITEERDYYQQKAIQAPVESSAKGKPKKLKEPVK